MQVKSKHDARVRRKYSVRKKVFGTPDRPRLTVFRSNKHIYAQIIDDIAGLTLASMSTKSKTLRDDLVKIKTGNKKAAQAVGAALAKQAIQVGIKCVRFDRDGYRYHGRVKALADGAREAGLVF
ncbi:MAG: 50S ribosomal protein L18 [Sedimentisphaerales bacterium]|nr:50S ribosomal protein L18 [Sedimentisphaerales bacterium]